MIEYTTNWVNGEVKQGWIMLVIGILLAIVAFTFWKNSDILLRGTLIPISLATLICVGYGSNLIWGRPAKLASLKTEYGNDSAQTIQQEQARLIKEGGTYKITIMIWIALLIGSILAYLFVGNEFYKGIGVGLMIFSFTALMTDIFLSKRAGTYLEQISNENHKQN